MSKDNSFLISNSATELMMHKIEAFDSNNNNSGSNFNHVNSNSNNNYYANLHCLIQNNNSFSNGNVNINNNNNNLNSNLSSLLNLNFDKSNNNSYLSVENICKNKNQDKNIENSLRYSNKNSKEAIKSDFSITDLIDSNADENILFNKKNIFSNKSDRLNSNSNKATAKNSNENDNDNNKNNIQSKKHNEKKFIKINNTNNLKPNFNIIAISNNPNSLLDLSSINPLLLQSPVKIKYKIIIE